MGIEGKLLVSRKNIVVNKESIGIDNVLTKDRNMNTFKTYCKRRKSGARFPDRKANNRLCACHCIAGNVLFVCFLNQRSVPKIEQRQGPFVRALVGSVAETHVHSSKFSCVMVLVVARAKLASSEAVFLLLMQSIVCAVWCARCEPTRNVPVHDAQLAMVSVQSSCC